MRTQTAGEVTLLAGNDYSVHQRVKVANGDGTLIDYSDYVERVTIDEDIDQPTAQVTVEFRRDASSTLSLAPLRTDSTLNRLNDGTTYSPALDAGRLITVEVATVAIGASPGVSDWKEVFRGYLDSVDAATPTVSIVCRDQGGVLVDRWIETERPYGYDTGIEVVMQTILDDTLGSGVVTLAVTGTPSFNIRTYNQQSESLMDALRTLAQMIGWDIRYKWNGTAFALTLYEPARSNTIPDRTFGASTYYDVNRLTLDRVDVRNVITINYPVAASNGARTTLTTTDATSIARYGRRFFGITEASSSAVDTLSEANVLIGNILSDLKDPKAEQEIEAQFFWPAELGDLYRFSANSVHYDTNQDWAVTNIRHDLWGGTGRTYLQVRGAPSGGFLTWIARPRIAPSRPLFDRALNFGEVARTATTATIGWTMERTPEEIWLWAVTPAQPLAVDPKTLFVGVPTVRLTAATESYEVTVPRQGLITYVRLVPVFANGVVGSAWDTTVQPGTAERLIQRATVTATDAATVTVSVAVANPTTGSDITVTPAAVGCSVAEGAQTILAAAVTDDISTTGTKTFTITRPAFQTGSGRVTFTATSTDRLPDIDAVDVPAQEQEGTIYSECRALVTAVSATTVTVTVTGVAAVGTPTVHLVALTGTATISSGAAVGVTGQASGSVWVFNRGAYGGGPGQAQFRCTVVGAETSDATVEIPEQMRDTVGLLIRATATSSTATQVVVRVPVADPATGGSGDVSIAYSATGSVSPASPQAIASASVTTDIATTGYVDFTLTRPAYASGNGVVTFTATRTGRVAGTATVTVAEQFRDFTANPVLVTEVGDDSISTPKLQANSVTAGKISVTNIAAIAADMGTLTAGKIDVGSIEINADTERILFGAATAPTTGTGVFLGKDGADYEFRVGDPSGQNMHWDGSTLTVTPKKIIGGGSTPSIGGIAALWDGTNSIVGTDSAGMVTLTTTTGGTSATGVQVTVTFATAFSAAPYVLLTTDDSTQEYIGTITTTTFSIATLTAGYIAGQAVKFWYQVIG